MASGIKLHDDMAIQTAAIGIMGSILISIFDWVNEI
jgi:hypothetical protein